MPNALILLELLIKATVHLVARFPWTFQFLMSQTMLSECTGGNVYPPVYLWAFLSFSCFLLIPSLGIW